MNPLEGRLIVISRLIAKRDALFSARPHVPLVIEPDPARKLALAMSLADVCSCLADEDISRGHPIKLLVRIIFSTPVRRRHRAVGRAQVVSAVGGYARWLTGIERTAGNRNGPCLFPLLQVTMPAHRMRQALLLHPSLLRCGGIIHQRADFPYKTPVGRG
jgi:hypothetical protein